MKPFQFFPILLLAACQNQSPFKMNENQNTTATDTQKVNPLHDMQGDSSLHALNIKFGAMQWQKIVPELGERSSEISILHVDPVTQATQLMIRVPKNIHVPLHWHSANETHTVISGTFIMECEGKQDTLPAGSFNYVPKRMNHQAYTTSDEGALLFITVDSGWDINWVNGPPKPEDFLMP